MTNVTEAPESQATVSRWEDYVDIYLSPAEVFDRRRDAGWGHPFLFLVVAGVVLYYLLLPTNSLVIEASMAQNPEAAGRVSEGMLRGMRLAGGLFVPFNYAILIALWAVILWGVARLTEIAVTFRQSLLVSTLSALVIIVQTLVTAGLIFLQRDSLDIPGDLSIGAMRFAGSDTPAVIMALLGRLDLFAIWMAVLWGVGLYVIGRTTKGRAAIAAGIAWLLAALPGMLMALLRSGSTPAAS